MPGYADERTEPATPRRRQEARDRGQVARSQDLTAAVLLLAAFSSLFVLGPNLWNSMMMMTRAALTGDATTELRDVLLFAAAVALESCQRLAPFLVILFVAMLVTLLIQTGFLFTATPLKPTLNKINPITGLQRLFSIRSVMLAVTSFGKVLVVGTVAYFSLAADADAVVHAFVVGSSDVLLLGAALLFRLGIRLAVALLILALLDFAWQRYRHDQDLRMTKEEVKDELRNMEGDPQIKRRRREVQMQIAMRRLRNEVPQADVVVTNPTHYAVAIAYNADTMPAPKVVAKGADRIAIRIRQLAIEHGVPIVQRPPLARALYDAVDVGQYVPERLYRAIAEILAYVYELTGRHPAKPKSARPRPVPA